MHFARFKSLLNTSSTNSFIFTQQKPIARVNLLLREVLSQKKYLVKHGVANLTHWSNEMKEIVSTL